MNLSVWHDVEEELPSYDNSLGKDGLPNTSTGLSYRSPSVLICTKEGVRVGYLQWRYDSPTTPYRWFLDGREGGALSYGGDALDAAARHAGGSRHCGHQTG